MGYTIVGNKIDTGDWDERQRKTPEGILNDVLVQLDLMKTKPQFRGSIILMHDGGGDRSVTVAALPVLIAGLRAHGYTFEQVSDLMGKTRAEVMPPLNYKERWQARVDSVAFFAWAFFNHFVVSLFFVGDVLMSARLILVGIFALIDRLRKRQVPGGGRRISAPGGGVDSRLQRRESHRAHHPLGAELGLSASAHHRDRRWFSGSHLRGGAGSLSGRDRRRHADGAAQSRMGARQRRSTSRSPIWKKSFMWASMPIR